MAFLLLGQVNRKMKKSLRNKLQSETGESIAEVLVALLISAIALMMLAGMITSSTNTVTRSRTAMNTYIEEGNRIVERSGTYAGGTVSLQINNKTIKLTDSSESSIDIEIYKNNSNISGGEVMAWTRTN